MKTHLVFSVLLLLVSCNGSKTSTNTLVETKTYDKNKELSQNEINGIISECNIIPLETSDESLLGEINDIKITDDNILIYSMGRTKEILRFDRKGKFIGRIGNAGRAKNEYLGLSAFAFDPYRNQILIADPLKQSILKYDIGGDYVGSIDITDKKMKEIIPFIHRMDFVDRDKILITCNINAQTDVNYACVDPEFENIKVLSTIPFKYPGGYIFSKHPISISRNTIEVVKPLNDTIFKYDIRENILRPSYSVYNDPKLSPYREIVGYGEQYNDIMMTLMKNRYDFIQSVFRTDDYLLISSFRQRNILWKKDDLSGYELSGYDPDTIISFPFMHNDIVAAHDNEFVSLLSAQKFSNIVNTISENGNNEYEQFLEGLNEYSNPILISYTMN